MRVYVDMDDVLCQTIRTLLQVLERRFGKRMSVDEVLHFDLEHSFGLSVDALGELMHEAHRPEVLAGMQPVAGARETLETLHGAGAEVNVVTGRPTFTADCSRRWLEHHAIPHSRLAFVDKYGRNWASAREQVPALTLEDVRSMGFGFAIEDSADVAHVLAVEFGVPVALIDRPWNRAAADGAAKAHSSIRRCFDWSDVRAFFDEHCG